MKEKKEIKIQSTLEPVMNIKIDYIEDAHHSSLSTFSENMRDVTQGSSTVNRYGS